MDLLLNMDIVIILLLCSVISTRLVVEAAVLTTNDTCKICIKLNHYALIGVIMFMYGEPPFAIQVDRGGSFLCFLFTNGLTTLSLSRREGCVIYKYF